MQRATWHVPHSIAVASESGVSTDSDVFSSVREYSDISKSSNSIKPKNESSDDNGTVKEVALKLISKKKVKGNEASVWEEMEVLRGLNHPNIVRALLPRFPFSICHTCYFSWPTGRWCHHSRDTVTSPSFEFMLTYANSQPGKILRVVRIPLQILPCF